MRRSTAPLLLAWLTLLLPALAASGHTFRLDTSDWTDAPHSVHLAGGFNGWSSADLPMTPDADGVYVAEIPLNPGVHFYKFVIDGERWINDPQHSDATLEKPDGHGGVNSAVLIGEDARDRPSAQPNHIDTVMVRHDPDRFAHRGVIDETRLRLGVTTRADDVETVSVVVETAHGETEAALHRTATELGRDTWAGLVPAGPGPVTYRFVLRDGSAETRLPDDGPQDEPEGFSFDAAAPFTTPAWAADAVWYQIFPERFRNGEPANDPGDAPYENLLPWTADWWAAHPEHGETPGDENFYVGAGNVWQRRFGGDLQGLQEKLPYLRRLGINAIYLNPIFEADSMHKYDTADYRHVDDNFGVKADDRFAPSPGETGDPATWTWSPSDRVFLDFLDDAHAQGFRVVIDGVFNHVGRSHPFFRNVLQHGKDSPYAGWFEITDWGIAPAPGVTPADPDNPRGMKWHAWDGPNGHLPELKRDDELGLAAGPRDHLFAITRRWMAPDGDPARGIDGWRLDAPQEVPGVFWRDWRALVKEINPDALLVGEIWGPAHEWLAGDRFDAVMNYQFAMPAVTFFTGDRSATAPSTFARQLESVAYSHPLPVALSQQNLFDSHDTDRLASMFVNPDRGYDQENRLQDSGPNYRPDEPSDEQWQRMEQALVCQMTFLGAPMIYYGTEAGMWSPDDPSDRMPMTWDDLLPYEDPAVRLRPALFDHFQRLIAIRHAEPALRRGLYRNLMTDDDRGLLAYERTLGGADGNDGHVVVLLNRGPEPQTVPLALAGPAWTDLLDPAAAEVVFDGDGRPALTLIRGGAVLRPADKYLTVELAPWGSAVLVPHPDATHEPE